MKKFPDIRKFGWKSKKSMKWNTITKTAGSGKTRTLTTWLRPKWTIEVEYPYLTNEEYRTLFGFVGTIKGAHEPFLWLDPEDHEEKGIRLMKDQSGNYPAVMKFGPYVEDAMHIEDVTVYIDGSETKAFSVDKGVIKLSTPTEGTVTADYTYYWKVQLSNDGFEITNIFKDINKSGKLKLVTVR